MFLLESNSTEKSQTTEWKLLVFSTNILPFMQLPIQDHFSKQQRCRRSRIYFRHEDVKCIVMICNNGQSKYGSINHLSPPCAKLFLCRIFDMNVCQKMCQMHSASVMGPTECFGFSMMYTACRLPGWSLI